MTEALVPVEQVDRDFAAQWIVIGPETARLIQSGGWDHHDGVQAAARHRAQSTRPVADDLREAAEGLEPMDGDDSIAFSFSGDMIHDTDDCVTQHRFYWMGDNIVIAVGEVNYPNCWDTEAFDAACSRVETALAAHSPARTGQALREPELSASLHSRSPARTEGCSRPAISEQIADSSERRHLTQLPADVRRLVIAARIVTDVGCMDDDERELFEAVEAFSSRVPYDDEPDDAEAASGAQPQEVVRG